MNQAEEDNAPLESLLKGLEEGEEIINSKLCCCLCNQKMNDPVTITPCSHTFCENCKHGYIKGQCQKCPNKQNIDSAYRNEFLQEISELLKLVKNGKSILEGKFRNITKD